jgi:hypothetical protein
MHYSYPFAVVRSAVASIPTNQFARRLMISILLSGFDGSVLLTVLPTIREASEKIPGLAMVFAVLVVGLVVTLVRTWLIAFRARKTSQS